MQLFHGLSLWANIGMFLVAAGFVWFAGTRIARYADTIAKRTGIGQAAIGLLLLGGVTSLPEIGVTVTSAWTGNTALAVNNLFGSIALQVALLGLVDAAIGRRALTSVVPNSTVLMQGALNMLLLCIPAAAVLAGDVAVLGIGAWAWACAAAYLASILLLSRAPQDGAWRPARPDQDQPAQQRPNGAEMPAPDADLWPVILSTAGLAAVILVAGFVLSQTGDAIAHQTGLGSSFVGFVLVAASTSLPELSSTLSAARLGNYTMALSDILGTNLLNVGLLFIVDLVAAGEPVLNRVGPFAAFGALLGIVVTAIFMVGLLERRDRTVLRMGYDSAAVLVVYLGGLVLLYGLK